MNLQNDMHPKFSEFVLDSCWPLLLDDLGSRVADVLERAGLPADLFRRENVSLTAATYFRFWNAFEADQADALFPLRVGQTVSTESFHPLFFAALCSQNAIQALERIARYKRLIGPFAIDSSIAGDEFRFRFDLLSVDCPVPESMIAAELVFMLRLIRIGTRENVIPRRVLTSTPLLTNPEYADFFETTPAVGEANEIVLASSDARRPFLTENARMWEFFEPEFQRRLHDLEAGASTTERVGGVLLALLPAGKSSIDAVADRLFLTRRTLQRALTRENTTYQKVLNDTREKLARHYLAHSDLPGEQISFLLGFDDPNSFARAFRSWTGQTPGAVRALLLKENGSPSSAAV